MIMKYLKPFSIWAGIISIVYGLLVIFGWHMKYQSIVRIDYFAPMRYNAAICFVLCGISLLCSIYKKKIISISLACIVLCLSALTLSQDIFSINFHIDELIMKDYMNQIIPGRMPPPTTICFIIIGYGLIISSFRNQLMILGLSGSVVTASSAVYLYGYITDIKTTYQWINEINSISLNAAILLFLLGNALLSFSLHKDRQSSNRLVPKWIPIPVFVFSSLLSIFIYIDIISQPIGDRYDNVVIGICTLFTIITTLGANHFRIQYDKIALRNINISEELRIAQEKNKIISDLLSQNRDTAKFTIDKKNDH